VGERRNAGVDQWLPCDPSTTHPHISNAPVGSRDGHRSQPHSGGKAILGLVESTTTALDIVTLIVAIVAALMGLAALVWNIAEFRLAGPRVKVTIKAAMLSKPVGAMVVGPEAIWSQTSDPRFDERAIAITARNVGRLPTTVEKYEVKVADGFAFSYTQSLVGPPIPHRLDAQESATWYIELHAAAALQGAALAAAGVTARPLRAAITLADGRQVTSDSTLIIPPSLRP